MNGKTTRTTNFSSLLSALKQCGKKGDLQRGKMLHSRVIESGCHNNMPVANALISMYGKCRSMLNSRAMFDSMIHWDVVSWTSLMLAYIENGESSVAMELFTRMNCEPDSTTLVVALKTCSALLSEEQLAAELVLEKVVDIHREARKHGLNIVIFVANALIDLYGKCGSMVHARSVFESIVNRNVVSWTSLISGYVENGENLEAIKLFMSMDCEPNSVTFLSVFKAISGLASKTDKQVCLDKGVAIHKRSKELGLDRDVFVATSLVDMYSKCGCMKQANIVFQSVEDRNVVLWNTLMLGYVENGEGYMAVDLYIKMDCEPNSLTYVAALKACGSTGELAAGESIYAQLCRLGLEQDQVIANSLIDLYGKCGSMFAAEQVLNTMHSQNIVSWTAFIAGYSALGEVSEVFRLLNEMQNGKLQMNEVTMVSVLTACSHAGMVEEGKKWFESMSKYGITPTMEHYTCMVDMLGRANRLQEALMLVKSMPFEADSVVWIALLGACRRVSNVEVGKAAFDALVRYRKTDAAPGYVLMDGLYSMQEKRQLVKNQLVNGIT